MNFSRTAITIFILVTLGACGGGGGGNTSTVSPTSVPTVIVLPPVIPVVIPPAYNVAQSAARLLAVKGFAGSTYLSAQQTAAFATIPYVKAVADSSVISDVLITHSTDPVGEDLLSITVNTSSTIDPGHYTGNISFSVCTDSTCQSQLPGSPFSVPYVIDVIWPGGSATPFNLSKLSLLAGAGDWGNFQGNAQHTGYVPVTLNPSAFNPRSRWSTSSTQGAVSAFKGMVTGGGLFYVLTQTTEPRSSITAYNESDGSKAWTHTFDELGSSPTGLPVFDNGKVFTPGVVQKFNGGIMYGINAATAAQLFRSPVGGVPGMLGGTAWNGNLYEGTTAGFYVFNQISGAGNFFTGQSNCAGWTPALDAQNLYGYVDGLLKIYNPVSGVLRGQIGDLISSAGACFSSPPVIGSGGMVYAAYQVMPQHASIIGFDTLANNVRWTAIGAYSGVPSYADGLVFAANNFPMRLEARNESDGSLSWSWTPPGNDHPYFPHEVLVTKNLVFVSTNTMTYAIDRTTHAAVWSYNASGELALSANGILYIQGDTFIDAINLR